MEAKDSRNRTHTFSPTENATEVECSCGQTHQIKQGRVEIIHMAMAPLTCELYESTTYVDLRSTLAIARNVTLNQN